IPSKRKSSACVDYVPALCTHRPSLLPIEWLSEAFGLAQRGRQRPLRAGKLSKLGHLEEVKVVTRSPLVNQRRDHYWVASAVYPLTIVNETVASLEGGENRPLAAQNSSDVISELLINKL